MMNSRKRFISITAFILALLMVLPIILSIIGAAAGAVSRSEIDTLEQQKDAIADKKKELQSQITDLREQQDTLLELKAALDAQNELTRQEIELIDEQIQIHEDIIEAKEAELEEALDAEQTQYEKYRARVRKMEENGSLNYLDVLFRATSFSDLLGRIDFIYEVMDYDNQLKEMLTAARQHVEEVKAEYEAALAEHEARKLELEQKKAELEAEIDEANKMIAQIEEDIEKFKKEYEANEAAEKQLQAEIDSMMAELMRQEEAAKKAVEESGGVWNGGAAFVGATGSYIWPLPFVKYPTGGSCFGYRIHPISGEYKFHAGIDLGAASGTNIYAIDSGTIVTAVYSSSYGNYVVVNHGDGNSSLYAHMSSMAVSVGQSVVQGQVIGYVGSTGYSTGPHLHFETRANGVLVDPMSYYGG